MLPTTFRNTLWFSEEELQEVRGTTLYRATELQVIYDRKSSFDTINQIDYNCVGLRALYVWDRTRCHFWH
jgi:hypothetical protein